jgi:hypothetical protein
LTAQRLVAGKEEVTTRKREQKAQEKLENETAKSGGVCLQSQVNMVCARSTNMNTVTILLKNMTLRSM